MIGPGLTPTDQTTITDILTTTYQEQTVNPASGVIVATGYGISLSVNNGELRVVDGYGPNKRVRTVSRHNRTVNRIIVIGTTGNVTLSALQWCQETHTSLAHVDRSGKLISMTVTDNYLDSRIRRAQATAFGSAVGLEMARIIIATKLTGHRAIMSDIFLCSPREIATMNGHLERLESAPDLEAVRKVESTAALYYFNRWVTKVKARWTATDAPRVPEHWHTFPYRQSLIGKKGPKKAVDPVNATLNYAYTLGEIECVHACHRLGLDPQLGILHTDKDNRDSMALDLLEVIRPSIEATVIAIFSERTFRKVEFLDQPDGGCRLTESVTTTLVTHLKEWRDALAPVAENVANQIITELSPAAIKERTPLTGGRARAGSLSGRNRNPLRPISEQMSTIQPSSS